MLCVFLVLQTIKQSDMNGEPIIWWMKHGEIIRQKHNVQVALLTLYIFDFDTDELNTGNTLSRSAHYWAPRWALLSFDLLRWSELHHKVPVQQRRELFGQVSGSCGSLAKSRLDKNSAEKRYTGVEWRIPANSFGRPLEEVEMDRRKNKTWSGRCRGSSQFTTW